jgi:hypothetical protein
MSTIVAASAIVTTIKNLFELMKGVRTSKITVFENIIKPMHAEVEVAVTDYYKFFQFLAHNIGTRPESYTGLSSIDLSEIEALSGEGKARRDGLRALANIIIEENRIPRLIVRYCEAIERIFCPIIDIGPRGMSASRVFVDMTALFRQANIARLILQ